MDINENILQAIQIVAESEVNKVSFDKTVVCEIIDDTNHDKGQYLVEENGAQFFAYCESTRYRNKQQVYVLIPGGKYDSPQKTIISRYSLDNKQDPITYIEPFEQLVILRNSNLVPAKEYEGLLANSNDEYSQKTIADFDTPDFDSRFCTTLGLKCEFKCLLEKYQIKSGEYGLQFELYNEKYNQGFSKDVKKKTLKFSSKDIFGNPFGFTSFVPQSAKLNIQTLDFTIKHIKIIFYQDNKFEDYNSGLLKKEDFFDWNIFVRNIQLYYANDVSLIQNKTFQIYCDNLYYQMDKGKNEKTIISKWYNVDKNNRYIGFEDMEKYSMEWLHSIDGEWKLYNDQKPSFEETKNIVLSKNKKREYFKAVLIRTEGNEKERYESNILTFENTDISEDPLAIDQLAALNINLGNNSKYSYPFYNFDNTLDNPAQAYIERELILKVQCLSLNITSEKFLEEATFRWYLPRNGTMLSYNKLFLEKKGFIQDEKLSKDNFLCFKSDKYIPFCYQIKPLYSRNFIHNDIICIATHNGIDYKASIHFDFSSFGMNNSSYYLAIVPRENEKKPGYVNGTKFELEALLFDASQKQVDLTKQKHITWILPDGTKNKTGLNYYTVERYYPNCANIYGVEISIMDNEKQQTVNLASYYGLPWSKDKNYCGITPTQIVYDSMGTNPKYYRDKNILFSMTDEEPIPVRWDIKYYPQENDERNYLPRMNLNKDALIAQRIYIHDLKTKVSLCAYSNKDNSLLWEQPIIISQNVHNSKVLNEWEGSLQINKEENYLLSAMLGAGRKNPNGDTFDGVLMGDLSKSQGDNNNIGLFGYNAGVQNFGFKIDGTAFLGKTGQGQINFDGNSGTITSGNYIPSDQANGSGMQINLENGYIDAFNFKLSAKNLLLDSDPEKNGSSHYFKIGSDNNIISLSKEGILDIHSNNFTLEAGLGNNYLGLFSSDSKKMNIGNSGSINSWRIISGDKFGVTKEGDMYASSVDLTGKIAATSGSIGSWTIDSTGYLYGVTSDWSKATILCPPKANNDGYVFMAGGVFSDEESHPFRVHSNGTFYATNAHITGEITATSGKIGNWSISNNYLVGNSGSNYTYIAAPGTLSDYVFSSGTGTTLANHNFYIKADGSFKASKGSLGNWTIQDGYMYGVTGGYYTYLGAPGSMGSYVMSVGNHNLSNGLGNNPFYIQTDGQMVATAGRIGGWVISGGALYAEKEGGSVFLSAPNQETSYPVINVGARDGSGSYFAVDGRGNMTARNAVITGEVVATKFTMGDISFNPKTIYVPNISGNTTLVTNVKMNYYDGGTDIGTVYGDTYDVTLVKDAYGKIISASVKIPTKQVKARPSTIPIGLSKETSGVGTRSIQVVGYY